MLTDPGLDLQGAVVTALQADAGVRQLVNDGVYDLVPRAPDGSPTVAFPYISFGDTQLLPELAEATDAAETVITLHCWSRAAGFPEVRKLARAVTAVLHDQPLTLASGELQSLLLESTQTLRDPDGLTSHAVLKFSALTDANN
jgi:hypothetical protein